MLYQVDSDEVAGAAAQAGRSAEAIRAEVASLVGQLRALEGSWQVGLRYEGLDLDDVVRGGEENNLTLGVNWYWRTNFKFMANYVAVESERRGIEDNPNIVELRAQLMF